MIESLRLNLYRKMNWLKNTLKSFIKLLLKKYINYSWKKRQSTWHSVNSIAILIYIPSGSKKIDSWSDGFTKAIDLLQQDYNITFINLAEKEPSKKDLESYDLILAKSIWGWTPDVYLRKTLGKSKTLKGLLISGVGEPPNIFKQLYYDTLWYETFWYKDKISKHPNIVHGFGIDTETLHPIETTKTTDVLSIGAIQPFKRHHLLQNLPGTKLIIADLDKASVNQSTFSELETLGFSLMDYLPQDKLCKIINKSKLVYIPATVKGGGERALLEARVCGIPTKIEADNPKLLELQKGPIWDHIYYYFQLRTGIEFFKDYKVKNYATLIQSSALLQAGYKSFHNGNFIIKGDQYVSIGNYCAFGNGIKIITVNHDYNFPCYQGSFYKHYFNKKHPGEINPTEARTKGPVTIGNDVWIGDNVTILSGVTIGDGACIGSGSIVTKDITAFSIAGGVPAKEIKKRFSKEQITQLEEIKWWHWGTKKILENQDFFYSNLNTSPDEGL